MHAGTHGDKVVIMWILEEDDGHECHVGTRTTPVGKISLSLNELETGEGLTRSVEMVMMVPCRH